LHEDAVDGRIGIEFLHKRFNFLLGGIFGQFVPKGVDANVGASLLLIAHIYLRSRIFAYQHSRKTWR